MVVTTTVDVKHLIDRGALEINPTFIPKTKEELINYLNDRADVSDWNHIFAPYNIADNMFNLTDFTSFTSFELKEDLGCAKGTPLDALRLHFLSEVTDSMFIIDLNYVASDPDYYRLDNVTVYDECHKEEYFKYTFKIGNGVYSDSINPGYISSVKFNADRFELKIELTYEGE